MENDIKSLPDNLENIRVHFVGIKGTGMVALVEILKKRGAFISGSDVSEHFYTDEILNNLGIIPTLFDSENINKNISFVVYSSAYSFEKNPELKKAAELGIPCMLYSEALGALSGTTYSCGICGVHGKTTTTGLTGTLLSEVDLPSQVLAGSIISSFGKSTCTMTSASYRPDEKNYFVAETCEYQRHFMAFHPQKIILTSVESDHQDYYPTYNDIRDAFVDYICKLPLNGQVIYCSDDAGAVETVGIALGKRPDVQAIPYGETAEGDYRITFLEVEKGVQYFSLPSIGRCGIKVPGRHNVRNSAAALALACELLKTDGKNPSGYFDGLKEGLLKFSGGKRRSEIIGEAVTSRGQKVVVMDDYGHHPTAINTTLEGFRRFYSGHKIVVDFMSHTYTRTAALLEEFASSFSSADCVIINKIYGSAREDSSCATVSGEILAEHAKKYHGNVFYCGEFDEAAEKVLSMLDEDCSDEYPDGWLFVTMGAGDNWKTGKIVLDRLRK